MSYDRIKTRAREALSGERLRGAALVSLPVSGAVFFSLINYVFNGILPVYVTDSFIDAYGAPITLIFAVCSLVLAVFAIYPVRFYTQSWFISRLTHRRILFGAKRFFESAGMGVTVFLLKALWLCAYLLIPSCFFVALWFFLSFNALNVRTAAALLAGIAGLVIIGTAFWLVTIQRYTYASFYFAASRKTTVKNAIVQSRSLTRGQSAGMLLFKASFLPWFILCLAVLPACYVVPYYKQSLACYIACQPISR